MNNNNNKGRAYKQVYDILTTLDELDIPNEIIEALEKEMDTEYNFDVKQDKLMEEAKDMLSAIYTDFLATDEEKEITLKLEKIYNQREEEQKKEKYDVEVFKKDEQKQEETSTELVKVEKESIIKRILEFFKRLFEKKES